MQPKKDKIVPIDNGKCIVVKKVKYTPKQVESVLRVMALIGGIRDEMIRLRATEFYSKKLDDLFDIYYKGKLQAVFNEHNKPFIADLTLKMTEGFLTFLNASYEISLQPDPVQTRYNREMRDLLISCGVSVPND